MSGKVFYNFAVYIFHDGKAWKFTLTHKGKKTYGTTDHKTPEAATRAAIKVMEKLPDYVA